MKSSVCTLFEGNYHFGVAALVNSLCANGFEGVIYAGFRGELPPWARDARESTITGWSHAASLPVTQQVSVVFLRLDTDYHLTNYKPDFMLDLFAGPASDDEALFYLDPDIVVNERWTYFTEWVTCGVALCEDVNSPVSENHPRRVGWRRFYAKSDAALAFKLDRYANGGFVGVMQRDQAFLSTWKRFNGLMGEAIGGLAVTRITGGRAFTEKGFANCFDIADQDGLNATIEGSDIPCSILGQEAMSFKNGASVLPHALGPGKPWARPYLASAIKGTPPRTVDKLYWQSVSGPIAAHSSLTIKLKRLALTMASLIGRFYSRR